MPKQLLLIAALVGCASADAHPFFTKPAPEVTQLRDEGRPALERLLAKYDGLAPGIERDLLATKIDRVAGQRYATVSRMFWYTDLEAAKAEAKAANKPILSLRMLGRLDEDLSCANSRYFRIALYANTELSKFLRDNFVLHWSSERAVPRVTVDFGDGRKLERTITGNSVHYVLDVDGQPIDALPGLYAPAVFKAELESALAALPTWHAKSGRERDQWLGEWHRQKLAARNEQWRKITRVTVPVAEGFRPEAYAQVATATKSGIEMPMYRVVDLGVNIGKLPDDTGAWAQVGLRLMPQAKTVQAVAMQPMYRGRQIRVRSAYVGPIGQQLDIEPTMIEVGDVIDASSKALLAKLAPMIWTAKPEAANKDQMRYLVDRFERDILADTAMNEFNVRMQIHGFFINHQAGNFEQLNRSIYDAVFLTSQTDPWLGLAPSGITALPSDGLVR